MKLRSLKLTATTNGSGAATVNASLPTRGFLYRVEWVVGTLATGVDAVLSDEATESGVAQTLLTLTDANANANYYPRYVVHSEAGAALTGTSGGDRTMAYLSGTLRLAVTSGGDTLTGYMIVWYGVA